MAWHLAHALDAAHHTIAQVYSRNSRKAADLAHPFNAEAVNRIEHLSDEVDVILICVSDDAIDAVAQQLKNRNCLIAHTSGAIAMGVLQETSPFYGVFYPLQSLSQGKKVDFFSVPILTEGNNKAAEMQLDALGKTISNTVKNITSEQRKHLHLAAVFANNFTNALYAEAAEILSHHNLSFDLLRPLISETAQKVQKLPPQEAQTGPAKRHDELTINKHLELLNGQPEKEKVYRLLTEIIQKKF